MRGKFIGGRKRGFCNTTLHPVIFSTAGQRERGDSSPLHSNGGEAAKRKADRSVRAPLHSSSFAPKA